MVIEKTAADALLPNADQTRTVGLVTLPGAFVGVRLSSGSAAQAGAVQILILIALVLSQSCAVALTIELVARGRIRRSNGATTSHPRHLFRKRLRRTGFRCSGRHGDSNVARSGAPGLPAWLTAGRMMPRHLAAGALAVLAAWPAAGPALGFLQFVLIPAKAAI